jgi:hypothetical protein
MNSFRIKDLRFRILKGGKIGLAASLMFFGAIANVANATTTVVDGNGGSGIFVGDTYGNYSSISSVSSSTSSTNLTIGNSTDTTVFTNYYTEGGAGSGGGAGLGGVFFVNEGSTLTLNNTTFKFNTSKGGEGGSLPSQVIEDTTININQLTLGLTGFEQLSITPTLIYSNGSYSFTSIKIGTGTELLNEDSSITFSELDTPTSAVISSVDKSTSSITLSSAVNINSSDIQTISSSSDTGFSVSGKVVTLDYKDGSNNTDTNLVNQIKDNITFGGQISFRNADGSISTKTISSVSYDTDGSIKSFELDSTISGFTVSSATALDIIPITKFETKPYEISGNTITVTGATRGFTEGMTLYDEDGNSTGAKITAVSEVNGVYTLTVDSATSALTDATSITGKTSPFLSSTQIQLSAPNPDLVGASSVNINGTDYAISNYDNTTGIVTLSSAIDSTLKSKIEVDGDLLTLTVNTVSVSGNTITFLDKGQNFATGMVIEGTNLTITGVSELNGNITLTLSGAASAITDTSEITAVDTLTTGGSMNNLAATGTVGADGRNGTDANYYSSFFNGGEGQAGTRGYAAKDGTGASGGDGGDGADGSDGLAVNPQLMTELWGATGDFTEAVGELATAIAPDGVPIPSPEYADLPSAIINVTAASIDLATAIANTVFWAQNLDDGLAGMGGEGGSGGDGGDGDDFFGGGAGGAGGNGGEGALSYTDGGNGGDGGSGGNAGFGAGGGAGGAGGVAGSTGGAEDGGEGDGGVAGFGGGTGSNGDGLYGNGGSGFGGAVFVRDGATLNITGNTLFEENSVIAGSSNNGGSAGESAGTALFMMKGSTVNLMPGFGNTIIFNDTIADDSASSYGGASYASGAGADIYIQGNGGLVEFNGENTYSGETYLQGATLTAALGSGINDNSRIVFNGAGTSAVTSATSYTDTLSLATVGTLLLNEDLVSRRVGERSIDVTWEGSGGIASGITDGIVVNFGKISGTTGQELTWGSNGFFESAAINNVLTFGSELSLGSVSFQNNVNIGSTNTARVAVYNTNLTDNVNSSSAILSGNWIGNELIVGEADNYDGNLILTGINKLNKLTILDGTTATSGNGKISDSNTAKTIVKMYSGKLILANDETLDSASINEGSLFVSNANLAVDSTVTNSGQVVLNTGSFNDNIINNGQFANGGNILVNANIVNDNIVDSTIALWNQISTISANNITNNGSWQNQSNVTISNSFVNDGIWYSGQQQIINGVASWVEYSVSTKNTVTTSTLTGTGIFDLSNGSLEINQSSTSIFDGTTIGQGSLTKSGLGTLKISNGQTFTGGLNVAGGTFETIAGASTFGTLADTTAIHVYKDSTFIAGVSDTVDSVIVEMADSAVQSGLFTMNSDISTQADFTNNGRLELNANLTTGDTNSSNGIDNDFINSGTTNLTASRTITTEGGLSGATTGIINVMNLNQNSNNTLTLNQLGNTTYSGKIIGDGSFTKTGNGNLILNGSANSVVLGGTLTIENGKLGLDGAGILNSNLDVIVSTSGELDLISGNQDILSLSGEGLIDLGSNKLNVTNGGSFTGTVIGNGTLHIEDGDFTVNNNIESTEGTFDVGTSTTNTGTTNTTTTISEGATLTFPDINVKSDGKLDLVGTADSNTVTILEGGVLHLGNPSSTTDSAKINTLTTSIYGTMTGTGTVLGLTTVKSGGSIKPGDSPGLITYTTLTLDTGSSIEMEINDSVSAGVDFDQIVVTDKLTIESGSTLNITKYDGGTLATASELSMGEKVKLFDFNEGSVSGKFDTINSTYTNDVIFNVASGEVIGLGGVSSTDFQNNVAQSENQKSILGDLNIDNSGNVEQFYGGYLVSRLASAYGNTIETNRIFNLASPEAYTSLIDQTRLGLSNTSVNLPVNLENAKEGFTANTNFDSKETSNSSSWTEYDIRNNSLKLEYTHVTKDVILAVSLTQNDGKITSDYMTSNSSGYDISIGAAKEIIIPGLSLRGSVGLMENENDVKRQTYTTDSSASNINTNGIITGMGLGYTKDYNALTFDFSADTLYYKANVDSFVENNSNKLDALSVSKQTDSGLAYKGKAKMSSKITEDLELQTGLNVLYMPNSDNFDVKAKVTSEETWFNVKNPGMGQISVGLDAGAKYKIQENMSLAVDAGINDIDQSNNGYNTNLSFTYNF